ncbi:hypothetical protein Hanom_Chr06g00488581 [Helianthus anomalus]
MRCGDLQVGEQAPLLSLLLVEVSGRNLLLNMKTPSPPIEQLFSYFRLGTFPMPHQLKQQEQIAALETASTPVTTKKKIEVATF